VCVYFFVWWNNVGNLALVSRYSNWILLSGFFLSCSFGFCSGSSLSMPVQVLARSGAPRYDHTPYNYAERTHALTHSPLTRPIDPIWPDLSWPDMIWSCCRVISGLTAEAGVTSLSVAMTTKTPVRWRVFLG